jgi:pimeloyl-ACP methyl ester carboxylesterase
MNRRRSTPFVRLLCVLAIFAAHVPSAVAAGVPRDKLVLDRSDVTAQPRGGAREWSPPARTRVRPKPCGDDPAWLCGSIRVPLDRANRAGKKINIGFELLPARNKKARRPNPVVVTAGGPGDSTTSGRYFWAFVMDRMNRTRDLLLIDPRGTGKSGALRCGRLQEGWDSIEELESDVAACGRKLGDAADR